MSIKFICDHCDQVLKVSSKKIGSKARCPKCKNSLTVPTEAEAAQSVARYKQARQDSGEEVVDPFAAFTVYDAEMELVYEPDDAYRTRAVKDANVDRTKLAVSRTVLYIQGTLLGVVALLFFMLGVIVGVDYGNETSGRTAGPSPSVVTGRVFFENGDDRAPDGGAVVIVVPRDSKPNHKVMPDNLRPGDELPNIGHPGLGAITDIGGAYCRADDEGKFQVTVSNRKSYYVLYISNNAYRRPNEAIAVDQRLAMGSYFVDVQNLIGENQFAWQVASIRGSNEKLVDVVFE